MKNVTITLDEEVARWARVKAAEQDKSLSRYIAELLGKGMQQENSYEAAMQSYFSRAPQPLGKKGEALPKRDEFYDRDVFRRYERADLRSRQQRD